MAMEDSESCGSRVVESPAANSRQRRRKLEVYNEVLRRLKESNKPEAKEPGFDDELWAHFNRLPTRFLYLYPILVRFPHNFARRVYAYFVMILSWCVYLVDFEPFRCLLACNCVCVYLLTFFWFLPSRSWNLESSLYEFSDFCVNFFYCSCFSANSLYKFYF